MFIKFWDENDNIVFWAIVALITMPIWGTIISLIMGIAKIVAWLLAHQIIFYSILFGIITLCLVISIIITWRMLKKTNTKLAVKLYFTLIPCLGTIWGTFCLYDFIRIDRSFDSFSSGFFGLISFLVWLIGGLIGFFVVLLSQIFGTCIAASEHLDCCKCKELSDRMFGYLYALAPFAGVGGYFVLYLVFDVIL